MTPFIHYKKFDYLFLTVEAIEKNTKNGWKYYF